MKGDGFVVDDAVLGDDIVGGSSANSAVTTISAVAGMEFSSAIAATDAQFA
jgi:hypothetical protein